MGLATGRRRLGIDIGGTFTDVAVHTGDSWHFAKTFTTPADPLIGMHLGLAKVPVETASLEALIHGTTLVANAIIERTGARTGLITTSGFRDVMEIGREPRYDLFDLAIQKPHPLISRALRAEVLERVRADGSVIIPLDEDDVLRAARELQAAGCTAVAVVLLHAYRNPVHERRVGEILAEMDSSWDVCLSSEISPEIGEYARTATTAANAYIVSLVRRYVGNLHGSLRGAGFTGEIGLMQSNGAIVPPDLAVSLPIRLIESGPAAGVLAAAAHGVRSGESDLISLDIGGTTAKICLIEHGQPSRIEEFEAARLSRFKRGSGIPLRLPVIELSEIGAGGGSLASVDQMGLLRVGPESAGAEPGPACYGRGGLRPTVTDADLVLGYLNPRYFLGGEIPLSPDAAERAVTAHVAALLNVSVTQAAWGIVHQVNSTMATAIRLHVVERGKDPARYALFAFGGAGPVHAYDIARRVGMRRVMCPPHAGVASALGLLIAPALVEESASAYVRLDGLANSGIQALLERLETTARRQLVRVGGAGNVSVTRLGYVRYAGQGHEIPVEIPDGWTPVADTGILRSKFEDAYRSRYGHILPASVAVEALTWRVRVQAVEAATPLPDADSFREAGSALKGTRRAFFPEAGGFLDCPVFERVRLVAGAAIQGPAIIEEKDSTIVVGPSGVATVDPFLNTLIDIAQRPSGPGSNS